MPPKKGSNLSAKNTAPPSPAAVKAALLVTAAAIRIQTETSLAEIIIAGEALKKAKESGKNAKAKLGVLVKKINLLK